ncbi:MAG: YfhO family protein, partial [Bacteroidales bacterium]|nr:YfhO family protein [Bacteroidales bacterium]
SQRDQLAVFSEIFYEKGWNAYVDGKKMPHFRVNYVLRGMIVPAGEHSIEFKFEPQVYETGETLSLISSIILLLLIIGGAVYLFRKQNGSTTEAKA